MVKYNQPLISVIMPVYNAEKYLKEAIESILNQTYLNFEFLIFNDASTDGSLDIINTYEKIDNRIIVFNSDKNNGYVYYLNKAIILSKGEYYVRMDADDISLPDRLQCQVDFMEKNKNIVFSGTWFKELGGGNNVVKLPFEDLNIRLNLLNTNVFCHPSVIIRKSVLVNHKLNYNNLYMPFEDYYMWTNLLKFGSLANIPTVLVHYRLHPTSISKTAWSQEKIDLYINTIKNYQRLFFEDFNLNQKELDLIYLLFTLSNKNVSIDDIFNLDILISKLKMKTENLSDELINYLNYYFYYICTTNKKLGIRMLTIYLRSKHKYPMFMSNVKLILKVLLNINSWK